MFVKESRNVIKACSICGSLEIAVPSLGEGGIPGSSEVAGVYRCKKCGSRMVPIVFDNLKEYRKFLKSIRKPLVFK
jgi:hypothetical protein